jgi:hypothetical protein
MSPDQLARRREIRTLWLELDGIANVSCHSPRYEDLVRQIRTLSDAFRAHNTPDDIAVIVLDPVSPMPARSRIKKARPTSGTRSAGWGEQAPADRRSYGKGRP